MKRIGFALVAFALITTLAFASNAQRQISSGKLTNTRTQLRRGAGEIYGISVTATASNGYATIYDYNSPISSSTVVIDLHQATANNTIIKDFPEGFKTPQGIWIELSGASTLIYYY